MARLSVIVPTFNRVGYLGEAIASILSQDYRDFELVVADNASTDGTAALLAGVTDPRLRHVRRAHNIGWRANFNQALRRRRLRIRRAGLGRRSAPSRRARACGDVHGRGAHRGIRAHHLPRHRRPRRRAPNRRKSVEWGRRGPGPTRVGLHRQFDARGEPGVPLLRGHEDCSAAGGVLRGGRRGARRLRVVPPRRARLGRRVPGNPGGRAPDPPRATLERARQQLHRRGGLRFEAPIPLGRTRHAWSTWVRSDVLPVASPRRR